MPRTRSQTVSLAADSTSIFGGNPDRRLVRLRVMRKNLSAHMRVFASDWDILQKRLNDANKCYNVEDFEDDDDFDYVLDLDGKRASIIDAAIEWVAQSRDVIDDTILGGRALFAQVSTYIQRYLRPR